MEPHEHQNGFVHLDIPGVELSRTYDLGEKFEETDGPPGQSGEPYLKYYLSFEAIDGDARPVGTLCYALTRSYWDEVVAVQGVDRDLLRSLALAQAVDDLTQIDAGEPPEWAHPDRPLFLQP